MALLSKSKYLIGLQCPKYFWIMLHESNKISEHGLVTQQRFDEGHKVGQFAKKLFPEGIDIPEGNFKENLEKSKELIKQRKPLFEVAFMVDNLYSRADILVPVGKDEWDIIEVKSATKIKEVNIHDVAFQKHVYEKAGLKIRKCFLLHINNKFVKKGEINPEEFFTKEDITVQVYLAIEGIETEISNILSIMKADVCPDIDIGKHCRDPYGCPLEDQCWGFLPEASVFDLYRGGAKSFQLFEDGVVNLNDIPETFKLNDKQGIQRDCDINNEIHVNKGKIKRFLATLQYPLYYFDFETFATAIPLYDGTKSYQQIPFQFSLHVDDGKEIKHYEFLANPGDERKILLEEMKKVLGDSGSIIVFYQSFEIGRLKELAEAFPEYKKWVNGIIKRIVDLIVPFQNFDYYNPKQKGSCSLKKVLPAMTGKGYEGLEISDGETASILFTKDGLNPKVRKDLLKYCELDTEAMIWMVDELNKLIKE
ncbi:DUF2779 domain-containing protein [Candidatus Woesearchaeota archaeon]|jgi:hypothetical protein|nr:DUF2779 domain-containing protein [Candidatus Woesearchaeota archaeon]